MRGDLLKGRVDSDMKLKGKSIFFAALVAAVIIQAAPITVHAEPDARQEPSQSASNSTRGSTSSTCTGVQCVKTGSESVDTSSSRATNVEQVTKIIANTLLFIVGIVAVIMLIISGLKYIASNGDTNQVKSAKDTILYTVVGVIVSIIAYAVVQFIIDRFA